MQQGQKCPILNRSYSRSLFVNHRGCIVELRNKKGLDGNPAPCKIQYPMKNQGKNKVKKALLQAGTEKWG